jgi:hypothetical protein
MLPRPLTREQSWYPVRPQTVSPRLSGYTRESIESAVRARRLIARYAGSAKLPRYLSDRDNRVITTSTEHHDTLAMRAAPVYARAYYVTAAMRAVPRLSTEIKRAEVQRGNLSTSPYIASDAEYRHNWGRLSVHQTGDCVSPQNVGIYQTGSNSNWNKCSTLARHCNYSLIYPATRHGAWTGHYVDCDKDVHRVYRTAHYIRVDKESAYKITPAKPTAKTLPVHVQRRILALATPRVLAIEYDRSAKKLMLVEAGGENYHADGEIRSVAAAHKLVATAVAAFRKRRGEKLVALESKDLPRVWVECDDSYHAGNCRSMTDKFARSMWQQIGAEGPCAVRADVILAARRDGYSLRACAYAAQRVVA